MLKAYDCILLVFTFTFLVHSANVGRQNRGRFVERIKNVFEQESNKPEPSYHYMKNENRQQQFNKNRKIFEGTPHTSEKIAAQSANSFDDDFALTFPDGDELEPVRSTDTVDQIFLKVARHVKESQDLGEDLVDDRIYLQLLAKSGIRVKDDSAFGLTILLRLLESLQTFLYNIGITVAAPIFKIRVKNENHEEEIRPSRLAAMFFSNVLLPYEQLELNSIITWERKLRYITDAILKSECSRSILFKNAIFQKLCMSLTSVSLASIIKPYQNLPQRKCKVSQFKPLKVLGAGGFGEVYLCRYTQGKDDVDKKVSYVAVKTMKKAGLNFKLQGREAKYLIQNSFPVNPDRGSYLVGCLCTFQTPNYVFVVMELLTGGSLADIMERTILTEDVVRMYAAQIFLAILDLHARGIVHRDIKPGNIIVDSSGNARLTDYGLSRMIGTKKSNEKFEDYAYHPYEMRMHSDDLYGLEVDWYGFGATIFQCLTNKLLPTTGNLIPDHLKGPLTARGISEEGIDLIDKLVSFDSEDRLMDPVKIQQHPWFNGTDWDKLKQNAPKIFSQPQDPQTIAKYSLMKPLNLTTPFSDIDLIDFNDQDTSQYQYSRFGKPPVKK